MTKGFKEFKFQQNLREEFTKYDEAFKNKIVTETWFGQECKRALQFLVGQVRWSVTPIDFMSN